MPRGRRGGVNVVVRVRRREHPFCRKSGGRPKVYDSSLLEARAGSEEASDTGDLGYSSFWISDRTSSVTLGTVRPSSWWIAFQIPQ